MRYVFLFLAVIGWATPLWFIPGAQVLMKLGIGKVRRGKLRSPNMIDLMGWWSTFFFLGTICYVIFRNLDPE